MKYLVFQHVDCEHPGSFRPLFDEDAIEWTVVRLNRGEDIPPLEPFDALWVLGGPMDVWDTRDHPWLVGEIDAIRHWVEDLQRPFLGLCLGHQLLAVATGGSCATMSTPEIGVKTCSLREAAQSDALLQDLPARIPCVQWHSVEVVEPPSAATILAESEMCRVQAMRIGALAWSFQFHLEIEPDTLSAWHAVPEYASALANTPNAPDFADFQNAALRELPRFQETTRKIHVNFLREVRNHRAP